MQTRDGIIKENIMLQILGLITLFITSNNS